MDLAPYNTFKVSVNADRFLVAHLEKDISEPPQLVLGEGANVLLTRDIHGLVVKNEIKGRDIIAQDSDSVILELGSGENWHEFVMWSVENGWSGIEDLAYIPGTVGAAAVGNIGAYGQSVADVITEVKTPGKTFSNQQCQFAYRESVFKKNKQIITCVTFKLFKTAHFSTDYQSRYESLKNYLPEGRLTPKIVAEAIIKIRQDKLPDWKEVATAGSFFKNPTVTAQKAAELQKKIAELQTFPTKDGLVKVPAGRLLDELGWKGKRIGRVATHDKHALIVINLGGATGQEILEFTQKMSADIQSHYAIPLEPEVKII
ncbi:MAG: UDP-N-acetylmuramate dehydrogenase [Patescibacteria group bacterium]|nr:UDP-N-acetylmuramate dehydrogenase [Patescibacteria group bacterium]MCL5431732.1 UDP-N-acetylmuramate dehydrogenase [Patescibacteria group bacterium]